MNHLDYPVLDSLKDVMEDDFVLLLETFIQDSNERIEKLQLLVITDDKDAIRRAAHSFKGSCSNIGATHLTTLCSDLEKKALAGDLARLGEDLAVIEQEFAQVRHLLHELIK